MSPKIETAKPTITFTVKQRGRPTTTMLLDEIPYMLRPRPPLYEDDPAAVADLSLGCGCPPDLTGWTFSRLTVLGRGDRQGRWRCQCECGGIKEIAREHLVYQRVKSCGCLRRGNRGTG